MAKDFSNVFGVDPAALQFEEHDDEDALLGVISIGGTFHHVTAIRVHCVGEDEEQTPTNDPYGRYDDFARAVGQQEPFRTVEIPDREGEWVIFVEPHQG